MGAPTIAIVLHSPPADDILLSNWHASLHQALTGLKAPPQWLELALTHMALAIIAQKMICIRLKNQKLWTALT
jgi:hypothetical protein